MTGAPDRIPTDRRAALYAERAAQDGQPVGNSRTPFRFAEWLRGVRDGQQDEAQRTGRPQQAVML